MRYFRYALLSNTPPLPPFRRPDQFCKSRAPNASPGGSFLTVTMIESFHAIVRYSAKGGTGKETVLAHGVYGGTALVPAAAAVPFMTLIPAAKPIHIVAIEDVVETVAWALRPDAPGRVTLDLVHPEPKTLAVIITGYRDWLGLRPHPVVTVPGLVTSVTARVADALSWLGWRSPARPSARSHGRPARARAYRPVPRH